MNKAEDLSGLALPAGPVITVEVCAAFPDGVVRETISLPSGCRLQAVRDFLGHSGALAQAWDQAAGFAVYGQLRSPQRLLEAGDRIEILRPLRADPKEARRQRAKLKRRSV